MSSEAKRRKVSMEPVLQDFTVTSFSDLHSDVRGPSDSSLFEEIKNYNVEVSRIIFNQSDDINHSTGPYPSDSSIDALFKPQSGSKTKPKAQRPFQKLSKKKSAEDNLFDSCFKDSFSDNSLENIHKPFQRKVKSKPRLSIFDSDLDSNKSVKESPFKKPFQRKRKPKQQSNLFDSVIKHLESNTPNKKVHRPFQRKSKKNISSNDFDEVFTNDSISQPSPVLNFITRRTNRMKKPNESNLFEDDLSSSQSDVSTSIQPLGLKLRTASNNIKNSTGGFDDLLDATCDESQNKSSSMQGLKLRTASNNIKNSTGGFDDLLDATCDESQNKSSSMQGLKLRTASNNIKNDTGGFDDLLDATCDESQNKSSSMQDQYEISNQFNERNTKSFNLEYNEETSNSTIVDNTSESGKTNELETEIEQMEEQHEENKLTSELSNQPNASTEDMCFHEEENYTDEPVIQSQCQIDLKEVVDAVKQTVQISKLTKPHDSIEHRSVNIEHEETGGSEENERKIDSSIEKLDSVQPKSQDESEEIFKTKDEAAEYGSEESEMHFDSTAESSETLQPESKDEETLKLELEEEEANESEKNEATGKLSTQRRLSDDQFLGIRLSLPSEINTNYSAGMSAKNRPNAEISVVQNASSPELNLNLEHTENDVPINNTIVSICTPHESFKDLPSSTPNIKGKRVSFLLRDVRESTQNYINKDVSTKRKSSIRSTKVNDSNIANNLTKDNSMSLRKRRVSFKEDKLENASRKQINAKHSDRSDTSKENNPNNEYSSVSLQSLVYVENSTSRTPDSESVYIEIHPSKSKSTSGSSRSKSTSGSSRSKSTFDSIRSKSTSGSNTESLRNCKQVGQRKSKSFVSSDSLDGDNEKSGYEETSEGEKSNVNVEGSPRNNKENNSCSMEDNNYTLVNTNSEEEFSSSEKGISTLSKTCETAENESEGSEEEKSDLEEDSEGEEQSEEEPDEEEEQVEDEEEQIEDEEDKSEEVNDCEFEEEKLEESDKINGQHTTSDQLELEQESEIQVNENSTHEEFNLNNCPNVYEEDKDLNPNHVSGGFKLPKHKEYRPSAKFDEQHFKLPSRTQLKDIMNKIPLSELKKRKKPRSSEHSISREQMQQYEIEEELMKNHKKKPQTMKTFSVSGKLKKPRRWVSPKLYDLLINKLKPQYGIRSRVRAEEFVLFLVECVENINKKKELIREDVEEMKVELARMGIIKTHWDFFKFVNQFFEYNFKEKMFPSQPGFGHSAFEFGPTNVMENIL